MAPTKPSNLSYEAITRYGERAGEHYKVYDPRGKADIDALLRILGGRTEVAHDNESMHVRELGDFTVFVPRLTSPRRDRFTIAHELGHYFLHYARPGMTGEMVFNRGGSDRAETEANFFAAALLMPTVQFAAEWKRTDGDVLVLSRIFDVSPRAVEVRASVLGLSDG